VRKAACYSCARTTQPEVQMAEGLLRQLRSDRIEAFWAGAGNARTAARDQRCKSLASTPQVKRSRHWSATSTNHSTR
jgi:hypothetical protein